MLKNNREDKFWVIAQAFYGSRTAVEITESHLDGFILGNVDGEVCKGEKVDRTIIKIPHTENLVLIYNQYEEMDALECKSRYFEEDGYVMKPLAAIPEQNLEVYSRCIVCRMNKDGSFASVKSEDCGKFMQYLAE